jgi:hypothetical protein
MVLARPAAQGFSPLDEELALLTGRLTPRLQEALVRLSTHIPSFAKASAELAFFFGVSVHPDTARRRTQAAGRLVVAHDTAEAERILRDHPPPPPGPDRLVFSVDGAMIPLVHGDWTEVRTLAVGEVLPARPSEQAPASETTKLSYFSRRLESSRFAEAALSELHRRGIERVGQVAAVVDGAEWCQHFIDLHQPSAVRILDFAHAAEYLSAIGQTVGTDGPLLAEAEVARLRHTLKHDGPEGVLTELRAVIAAHPSLPELPKQLAYLEKRVAQMAYPQFVAAGWPIGSGMVESANKLVVEDRLKGAGMHWADANVNPMLALRNALCNDRWAEVWEVIEREEKRQVLVQRQARRASRQAAATAARPVEEPPPVADEPAAPAPPPPEPVAKARHPWTRAWSIRRQRELAGAA